MTAVDLTPRRPREPDERELRLARRVAVFRRLAILAVAAALVMGLVGIGYTVVLIRQSQVENTARAKSTNTASIAARSAADRIEECTTPGRACYERGQSQTTSAVVDVNRVTVLAAYCATRTSGQDVADIRACVLAGLRDPDSALPRVTTPPSGVTSPRAPRSSSATPSASPRPQSGVSTPRPTPRPSTVATPRPSPSPATSPQLSPAPAASPSSRPTLLCVLQLCVN